MPRAWKLGTAFGIGLYVHWTFLLLLPYIALMVWESDRPWTANLAAIGLAVPLVVCVFGCVLLHELGHALAARFCNIATRDITLYPIGGVARLERMSERPGEEILIAIAGPAVNVVIAGVLLLGLFATLGIGFGVGWAETPEQITHHPVSMFFVFLVAANVILVAFNMLPCFPMDGGRVLRALLSLGLGHLRATEVATTLGMVVAFLLGLLPVFGPMLHPDFQPSPMLIVVAGFVFFAGQQELAQVRQRAEARRLAANLPEMPIHSHLTPLTEPPSTDFSGFTWDDKNRLWVVWRDGRVVATFTPNPE